MQIVIDIPDNEYHQICELRLHNRTFYDDAIRNGTPLDEVIEDIKQEIAETYNDIDDTCIKNGLNLARKIIDNHTKGESE